MSVNTASNLGDFGSGTEVATTSKNFAPKDNGERQRRDEIKPLTSLRFFAALLVFIEHLPMLPGLEWMGDNRIVPGTIGVTTFFVLSGYIIGFSYFDEPWQSDFRRTSIRFYVNRIARIYPLHWLAFLIALPLGLNSNTARVNMADIPQLLTLTERLWPLYHASSQPVKAAWTLSCEVLFYLLTPFILVALRRARFPLATAIITCSVYTIAVWWATVQQPSWNWSAYVRVPEFLVGIIAFLITRKYDIARAGSILFALGICILIAVGSTDTGTMHIPPFSGYTIGAVLLVLGCNFVTGKLRMALSAPILVLFGHASYALYLLHDPYLRYSKVLLNRLGISIPGIWDILLGCGLFAFTLLGAIACFRFVESPARRKIRSLFSF